MRALSRSTANWIFFVPLAFVGVLLVKPSITGGSEVIDMPVDAFGLLLGILGLLIRVISRDWKITHSNGKLVTSGPYSVVRHPMYAGTFLSSLGLCVIIGNLPFIAIFAVVFILAHMLVVRGEEKHIAEMWPDEFQEYRKSVPAIFPRLSRVFSISLGGERIVSSRRNAVTRELSSICGVVVTGLLLEVREDYVVLGWSRESGEITAFIAIAFTVMVVWIGSALAKKARKRSTEC